MYASTTIPFLSLLLLSYFAGCAAQRLIKTIDHKLNTDLEGLIWDLEAIQ